MPAAATHRRSTTSRGDPQQEHDHRRFRADHEAVEQDSPAGRGPSSSSDGKLIVAPDARVAVRLGFLSLALSHRPKIELMGHSRAGAFKPR